MSADVVADLVGVFRGCTPADITQTALGQDIAFTIATMMASVEGEVARLLAGARISTAVGSFLRQHGKDRGLSPQDGETDDHFRARLQRPPQAGTVEAIASALQFLVNPSGVGDIFIIEIPLMALYPDRSLCFDRGLRLGAGRGVVVALIPASANALTSAIDAVRSKVSAGKLWHVEEYTDA